MPSWIQSAQRLFKRDWFVALVLLGIYLATNRYIYAWDDQHLEITLLKHLIDPSIYQGDYYVESLKDNFTSYLYPILSRFINVQQIPPTYLFLFLLSRYFMFYWVYRLWKLIAHKMQSDLPSAKGGLACVLVFILVGRTEEFLYRTFSHQEFALGFIFAGIYYFFKERYFIAALILGFAANFHALYALFPMMYMSAFLLLFNRLDRCKNFLISGVIFVVAAMPFLLWAIPKAIRTRAMVDPHIFDNWIELYRLACPQNFPFQETPYDVVMANYPMLIAKCAPFIFVVSLFVFNFLLNDQFRKDRKIAAITLVATLLVGACFYASYVHPSRFVLDLNLVRNEQFLRFFLIGYTVLLFSKYLRTENIFKSLIFGVTLCFIILNSLISSLIICAVGILLGILEFLKARGAKPRWTLAAGIVFLLILAGAILKGVDLKGFQIQKSLPFKLMLISLLIAAIGSWLYERKGSLSLRPLLIALPLFVMFGYYCYFHYQYVQATTKGGGFWQLQRNWEDMQRYVRDHTPKDAFILTPYNMEMGSFRIHSERKVLVCYRDCGIIGFDYNAVLEWQRRIEDVKEFKVFTDPQSIGRAVTNALSKYKVDYIVFMRYYAPGENPVMQKMYDNEVFSLYKVMINQGPQ